MKLKQLSKQIALFTAYHEAGHAYMAYLFGVRVDEIQCVPVTDFTAYQKISNTLHVGGKTIVPSQDLDRLPLEQQLAFFYAGYCATSAAFELKLLSKDIKRHFDDNGTWRQDRQAMLDLFERVGISRDEEESLLDKGRVLAIAIVTTHWSAIKTLADCLIDASGVLKGASLQNAFALANTKHTNNASLSPETIPNKANRPDFRVSSQQVQHISQWGQAQRLDLTRPFIFVNANNHTDGQFHVPANIWNKALGSQATAQVISGTIEDIENAGIELNSIVRERFFNHEPILVDHSLYQIPAKLPRGFPTKSVDAEYLKEVLQVTTHTVTERIRLLKTLQNEQYDEVDIGRSEVWRLFVEKLSGCGRYIQTSSLYTHLLSLRDKGRKRLGFLYPAPPKGDRNALSNTLKAWAEQFRGASYKVIDTEINFQQLFLRSLLMCEGRMDELTESLYETTRQDQQNPGALPRGISGVAAPFSYSDGLLAAFAGFHPAQKGMPLFPHLKSFHMDFETAWLLGRLDRGYLVEWQQPHIDILATYLCDSSEDTSTLTRTRESAQHTWTRLLDRIDTSDGWSNRIIQARIAIAREQLAA